MSPLALTIWIGAAGALGTLARYGLTRLITDAVQTGAPAAAAFPWGVAAVNALGSLAFGFVFALSQSGEWISRETALVLLVGFLGAFTTFSTFSFDTVRLLTDGRYGPAAANALGQVAVGLLAVGSGLALGNAAARLLGGAS